MSFGWIATNPTKRLRKKPVKFEKVRLMIWTGPKRKLIATELAAEGRGRVSHIARKFRIQRQRVEGGTRSPSRSCSSLAVI